MENGPVIFAGLVFALFGAGLAVWTATRLRQGLPVAHGVRPAASATIAGVAALAAMLAGAWCLTQL